MDVEEEKERRVAIVQVSLQMLETLFADQCTVVRAGITDNDFVANSISLLVTGHPDLPIHRAGCIAPYYNMIINVDDDGKRILSFRPS